MTVKTSYRFTPEEFTLPYKLHTWKVQLKQTLLVLGISVFILCVGLTMRDHPLSTIFIAFGIVKPLFLLLSTAIAKRRMKKMPIIGLSLPYEANDAELKITGDGINTAQNWGLIHSAYVAKEGALIYQNKRLFNWFPFQNAEPEDAREQLLLILERAGVTYKEA